MRADYRCPRCGTVVENHTFSAAVGAKASAPFCPKPRVSGVCQRTAIRMEVIPTANFSLRSDGEGGGRGKESQAFTVHRQQPDRHGNLVQVAERVAGLADIRRIEKDSEQRYANGEGEPLRFRAFSQDSSNADAGSFG